PMAGLSRWTWGLNAAACTGMYRLRRTERFTFRTATAAARNRLSYRRTTELHGQSDQLIPALTLPNPPLWELAMIQPSPLMIAGASISPFQILGPAPVSRFLVTRARPGRTCMT